MAEKKRYWLKLEKDFLKSKYIKIIKDVDNGNDYILFYLALMLESVDSVGHLRFTELVPYNEKMLSSLTDTNIDIVRSAMKLFIDLGLIKLLEDGTFFIPDVPRLTGKESESAERVRQFRVRESQKALHSNNDVTNCNDSKEKEEEKQEQVQEQVEVDTEEMKQALRLAELIESLHRVDDSKYKGNPKLWAKEIERLIRLDQREPEKIEKVIRWCKSPGNFWFPNIMSGKKLREKYPTLLAQMTDKPKTKERYSSESQKSTLDGWKTN